MSNGHKNESNLKHTFQICITFEQIMARNVEFDEERAIQKAMEVFWKKGYSGASMRDLTGAMQINASSL